MPRESQTIVIQIIVLFLGIGLHEYAHCKMADAAGDPTPRLHGRVTLNLTKHFSAIGTMMMIISSLSGFGIGWGKPAPMDPRKMRHPRWDFFAAVAAGPVSNLLQAMVYAMILRATLAFSPQTFAGGGFLALFLIYGIAINLGLCFFNLIPLGPLDGNWLLGLLMPERQRYNWFRFNQQFGMMGLFALIIVSDMISRNGGPDVLWSIIGPPIRFFFSILTGLNFNI